MENKNEVRSPEELYKNLPIDEATGKRQIFIDASALKNASCFRHLWWTVVECYQSTHEKAHRMAFGSAIHLFLEDIYKGIPVKAAIERAVEYYKPYNDSLELSLYEFRTTTNLIKICLAYVKAYSSKGFGGDVVNIWDGTYDFIPHKDKQGKPLVEYKFAIPIWANDYIDLILSGTIDLVASYNSIPHVLVDHKTTAMKVDDKFFAPYDWDIQPMLYCKVWKEANNLDYYPPFIINGIGCKKPTEKAAKEGRFDGVEFKRGGLIQYDESQMKWFDIWLGRNIQKLIANLMLWGKNYEPSKDYNMSACKSIFGQCKYFSICKLPINMQQIKLQNDYVVHHYNPLKFRD